MANGNGNGLGNKVQSWATSPGGAAVARLFAIGGGILIVVLGWFANNWAEAIDRRMISLEELVRANGSAIIELQVQVTERTADRYAAPEALARNQDVDRRFEGLDGRIDRIEDRLAAD